MPRTDSGGVRDPCTALQSVDGHAPNEPSVPIRSLGISVGDTSVSLKLPRVDSSASQRTRSTLGSLRTRWCHQPRFPSFESARKARMGHRHQPSCRGQLQGRRTVWMCMLAMPLNAHPNSKLSSAARRTEVGRGTNRFRAAWAGDVGSPTPSQQVG